jgi:hypothetical protein
MNDKIKAVVIFNSYLIFKLSLVVQWYTLINTHVLHTLIVLFLFGTLVNACDIRTN